MFRNDKKGRLYGIKKDTTFVENPSIEDTTTKVTSSINFSKSNFLNLCKWILIIVLFLYFGSYTINGFIASNITKNSTEETIISEYTKIIGYEEPSGQFDFLIESTHLYDLVGYTISSKRNLTAEDITEDQWNLLSEYLQGGYDYYLGIGGGGISYYYNGSYVSMPATSNIQIFQRNYYSTTAGNVSDYDRKKYIFVNVDTRNVSYSSTNLYYSIKINSLSSINTTIDIKYIRNILNMFYTIDKPYELIPIYETTTYTYQVKDINYNWDYKLKQISKFRPLFKNDNIYFKNEEYSNLINLNTFIIPTMSSNEYKQKMIEEKILIDEKVIRARDLGVIDSYSFSSYRETSWFNDNDNSFFYLTLNDVSSSGNYELTELVYYLNSNYVTNYTKDNYKKLLESDNFGFDDLIIFPIRLVGNLVYNFGVLVGIITIW